MANGDVGRRDGGYAWVIVFAFFALEVLVDGIRFSFGLLFVEWSNDFGTGKGETAWLGSIMISAYNLCGPLLGVIVNKIGCRAATTVGSVIGCAGFLGSFFASNIFHLILTYSIMQGFGFGLIFLAGTVSVGRYFFRRRALAFGIAYGGSGVGTLIFNPIMPLLLDTYTWRGCMLIFAGLSLNCCVFGMLLRPLHVDIAEEEINSVQNKTTSASGEREEMLIEYKQENGSHVFTEPHESNHELTNGALANHGEKKTISRTFKDMRMEQLSAMTNNESGSHRSLYASHRSLPVVTNNLFGSNISFEYMIERQQRRKSSKLTLSKHEKFDGSGQRTTNDHVFVSLIKQLFPRELVTDFNFITMCVSAFFFGVAIFIPIGLLPDFCLNNGCTVNEASWLVSVFGIGGTIGRVISGYLTDLPTVNSFYFFNICLILAGVFTCINAFLTSFKLILVYACAYGLTVGASYTIQAIVLMEFFGEKLLPEIIGILMLSFGFSTLIGTPIAGWMFDGTGSYKVSFLFAGALYILSGAIMFLVLCTRRGRAINRRVITTNAT